MGCQAWHKEREGHKVGCQTWRMGGGEGARRELSNIA